MGRSEGVSLILVRKPMPAGPRHGRLWDAINFPTMTDRDEIQFVSRDTEFVDHPVITHPQTKLRSSLQAVVRPIRQLISQMSDSVLNSILRRARQAEENRIELARVDLGRLTHTESTPLGTCLTGSQVGLAALDAGDELRRKRDLVFEKIGEPILQAQSILPGQFPDFSFEDFKLAHDFSVVRGRQGSREGDLTGSGRNEVSGDGWLAKRARLEAIG